MSNAWMPGARYMRAAADGGPLKGGAPRAVWDVLGADPAMVSAGSAAQRLDQARAASHLVWNPRSGEIAQLIPIVRAARSLGWAEPAARAAGPGSAVAPGPRAAGDVAGINTEGRICVQIFVVGLMAEPFTDGPMAGLREIMSWLDSWGVPRTWPAGAPAPFPDSHLSLRSRRLWARGGHFGVSQVPGVREAGPGAIDVDRLTGWPADQPATDRATAARATAARATAAAAHGRADHATVAAWEDPAVLGAFIERHVASAATLSQIR